MAPKGLSMPGKDVNKQFSYPPCNRAFALRMMNPTSYADERTSIFDKEIQPVVKKSIAKSISESPDSRRLSPDTISFDGESISTTSSDTSFSEMELYDIDEIENETNTGSDKFGMIRQHSSLDNYTRSNKLQRNKTVTGNEHMIRSYSSVDGFEGHFSRNSAFRSTLPSNVSKGSPSITRKPYRQDALAYLNDATKKSTPSKGGGVSSLKRSHSLKSERTSSEKTGDQHRHGSTDKKNTKIRVAGTKSSQLRAKLHDSATAHQQHHNNTPTKSRPTPSLKHRQRSRDEYSGSDSSSTAFSELDAHHTRHHQARHTPNNNNNNNNGTLKKSGSKRRSPKEHVMRESSTRTSHTASPLNASTKMLSPNLPKNDTFSARLTQLCNLISERHPGDFQILETLVEMQSAYEERNALVTTTISSLREKISSLENKLANSPNIPGLVIPLMRATNTFQNQLQSIMDSSHRHDTTTEMHDVSVQFPEANACETITMAEISTEANNVVKEIEKLGINSNSSDEHDAVTPTYPKNNVILNGHVEPKMSLLNDHHVTADSKNTEFEPDRYTANRFGNTMAPYNDVTNSPGYTSSNYYGKTIHHNNNSPLIHHRVTTEAALTAMAIDSMTS